MPAAHVIVIGGGLAGLASAVSLTEQGLRVTLLERRPRLGGRATSYLLPNGEYIDNCQHVTLRCCTNLEHFYRRIGVDRDFQYYDRLTFTDSKARRGVISLSSLPAPLHMAPSFAAFPLLTLGDKLAIAKAIFRILRHGGVPPLNGAPTMLKWLHESRQTETAIARFWRVVLVSALNEELDRIDAAYGIAVFWKAFMATPAGFGVGIPRVPLADLYQNAAQQICSRGGEVRTRCGVSALDTGTGGVRSVRTDDGTELQADYYLVAVPFDRILKLLPQSLQESNFFAGIAKLGSSPITSVHLWFDRHVMTEPFWASVDQTIQWVFNKTGIGESDLEEGPPGQYVQAVISASRNLTRLSQQDVIDLCRQELTTVMPAVGQAKLRRAVVVRESAATFSVEPGSDSWRPEIRTPVDNLFLAGDWTRTGWPATMESAVRSGYLAAEAILEREGRPVRLLKPELPASGMSAWFARHRNKT